jgi:hypothetical protein
MLKVGDKVEIVSSTHSEIIGIKDEIIGVTESPTQKYYYFLDKLVGYWTDDELKKLMINSTIKRTN